MNTSTKNIAIYGGAFNPIHHAHIAIAHTILDKLNKVIDEVWVLPTGVRDDKADYGIDDIHRVNMIKLAFIKEQRIKVYTTLLDHSELNTSWQLHQYLLSLYPNYRFYHIFGADALEGMQSWWQYGREVYNRVNKVLINRGDHTIPTEGPHQATHHILTIDIDDPHLSSSKVRDHTQQGFPIDHMVPTEVAQYIFKNNLYEQSKETYRTVTQ